MSTSSQAALSHIPIFRRLDGAGRADLEARLTRRTVPAGEPVFWFGDDGDTLYVVDTGIVEVTAPDTEGRHVLLDTLGPGGIFGELSLFDGGPRSATVRARTDTVLLELHREAFHDFLRARPDVAAFVDPPHRSVRHPRDDEVVVGAQKKRKQDNNDTACKCANKRVRKKSGIKSLDAVHGFAEQDADKGAQDGKQNHAGGTTEV